MAKKTSNLKRRNNKSKNDNLSKFAYDYSKDYTDPKWPYAQGRNDKMGKLVLIITPIIISVIITYVWYADYTRTYVVRPLPFQNVIDKNATSSFVNPERFWGTYRSNVYFGLKTRTPHSPVVGLMWMNQFAGNFPPKLHHWCDQGKYDHQFIL